MKKIKNLAITGITTLGQMELLAKLTNTNCHYITNYENSFGIVYYSKLRKFYNDWTDQDWNRQDTEALTWEQFVETYGKQQPKELPTDYPMYFKDVDSCLVVKFTALTEGTVVVAHGKSCPLGYRSTGWFEHTNTNHWIQVSNPEEQSKQIELQTCRSVNDKLAKENKKLKKQLKKLHNQKITFNTDTLEDKQLMWSWDNDQIAMRRLSFWDKQNSCVFAYDGTKNGSCYNNYKPYKGKIKNWMKIAREILED